MATKYRYKEGSKIIETLTVPNASVFEVIEYDPNPYDAVTAQLASMDFGKQLVNSMLIELGARAKAHKQATGQAVGSGLIDLNSKLENYLNKGALEPDAINEIQTIVNSGQVDSFLDVYADAIIRIDDFLGRV